MFFDRNHPRRLAEKNIPNCAGFSFGFKARGRCIVHYVTVIATQKLDDKDKQVGIFFDRNRLSKPILKDPLRVRIDYRCFMTLLALDFDGVLCDSVLETAISGWKAGAAIWPDMSAPMPPDELLSAYRSVRPLIETGHEALLMMRLLKDNSDPRELFDTFPERLIRLMEQIGTDHEELQRLYGAVRDRWIEDNAGQWSSLSPLYPGIKEFLGNLPASVAGYIITTKQERFVRRLLDYNGVAFPAERIFGLERGVPKETILRRLLTHHPGRRLYFIEDRLATLIRIMARTQPGVCRTLGNRSEKVGNRGHFPVNSRPNSENLRPIETDSWANLPLSQPIHPKSDRLLATVRLYLADWGYNTGADRKSARESNIPILELHRLLALTFLEDNK
ncbi:MAG: Phosphoglycolate phosphatase, HAD superfamily [Candidatus Kentron sp. G]|nr:MAG: Phosphoglycolate phosphatase, HAD superfamily [Candidatus Kentron sp. G]VFN02981.1 MAG: Phosphoglycolate phosphatase, HAD superfamily [Candidatus Kentron sp. G]